MNITAAINIPCVSQTNLWKGCFEAHFMSGREIDVKYPILNIKWKYSHHKLLDDYDGYYYAYDNYAIQIMFDPWFREFKVNMPISDDVYKTKMYHTTVESNAVLLVLYKKKD
jgi:hypothetical protein